jgi:hypothetical protein
MWNRSMELRRFIIVIFKTLYGLYRCCVSSDRCICEKNYGLYWFAANGHKVVNQ